MEKFPRPLTCRKWSLRWTNLLFQVCLLKVQLFGIGLYWTDIIQTCGSLEGLGVAFQVLMLEDSGSNPEAVRSICGPQYGLVVCCLVSAYDSTDSREISNNGNPSHPHLFTSFQHSSLDGAQVGPIKPFGTPSTNFYTQHSIL